MKPFDPRLLAHARSSRGLLVSGAALGLGKTICTIAVAAIIASVIAGAVGGASLDELAPAIGALVLAVLLRGILNWWSDAIAAHGAARVKSELRRGILDAVTRSGPAWLRQRNGSRIATILGRGIDALDGYFAGYLPQVILTVVSTPILVAVTALADPVSAIVMVVTLPLIPVFMVLIGWATQAAQRAQWRTLGRLSSGFVDVIGGLPTLTLFGRQHRLAERMRRITADYRTRTMRVLRISFLSGFVLELAASLAVAIVAVTIGLRLVDGQMDFGVGLFVLLLAPEVFLPIRQVGAAFHAASEGLAAAEEAFEIIEDTTPEHRAGVVQEQHAPLTPAVVLELRDVAVSHPGREPLEAVSLTAQAGSLTVLSGPSGSGKSSLFAAVNGFASHSGSIAVVPAERIAWAPQFPMLVAGTVADNIALGSGEVDRALVRTALELAAASELAPDDPIGVGGTGLSGGQAARVGIARAFYRVLADDGALVLLDEPSAALDRTTESSLLEGIRVLTRTGIAVVVASHRGAFLDAADSLVRVADSAERDVAVSVERIEGAQR